MGKEDSVGVVFCNLISSLDKTVSGFKGTIPAPRKPLVVLPFVIGPKKASLKAEWNSTLVIWLMWMRMNFEFVYRLSFFLYFKIPNIKGLKDVRLVNAHRR